MQGLDWKRLERSSQYPNNPNKLWNTFRNPGELLQEITRRLQENIFAYTDVVCMKQNGSSAMSSGFAWICVSLDLIIQFICISCNCTWTERSAKKKEKKWNVETSSLHKASRNKTNDPQLPIYYIERACLTARCHKSPLTYAAINSSVWWIRPSSLDAEDHYGLTYSLN